MIFRELCSERIVLLFRQLCSGGTGFPRGVQSQRWSLSYERFGFKAFRKTKFRTRWFCWLKELRKITKTIKLAACRWSGSNRLSEIFSSLCHLQILLFLRETQIPKKKVRNLGNPDENLITFRGSIFYF